MYPFEVATIVQALGRRTVSQQPDGERPAVSTARTSRFLPVRRAAGRQLIRLGEALAGRQPGPAVQLAGDTHRH